MSRRALGIAGDRREQLQADIASMIANIERQAPKHGGERKGEEGSEAPRTVVFAQSYSHSRIRTVAEHSSV